MTGARHKSPPKKQDQDANLTKLLEEIRAEFSTKMSHFESLLKESQKEVAVLKTAMEEKEREVSNIKVRANDQEQYMRSWSIRILNLAIPRAQDASDPDVVMRLVFSKVLEPIFRGAMQQNIIAFVPRYDQVLETAHILPAKPNQTPPIIARFYSRNTKALMFRLKKEFAPKLDPTPAQSSQTRSKTKAAPPRLAVPVYEDLTTHHFRKMRALAGDSQVLACWSVAGQLRLRLSNDDKVHKVMNTFDTVDAIIASIPQSQNNQPTSQPPTRPTSRSASSRRPNNSSSNPNTNVTTDSIPSLLSNNPFSTLSTTSSPAHPPQAGMT